MKTDEMALFQRAWEEQMNKLTAGFDPMQHESEHEYQVTVESEGVFAFDMTFEHVKARNSQHAIVKVGKAFETCLKRELLNERFVETVRDGIGGELEVLIKHVDFGFRAIPQPTTTAASLFKEEMSDIDKMIAELFPDDWDDDEEDE